MDEKGYAGGSDDARHKRKTLPGRGLGSADWPSASPRVGAQNQRAVSRSARGDRDGVSGPLLGPDPRGGGQLQNSQGAGRPMLVGLPSPPRVGVSARSNASSGTGTTK